jgi:hypothetical protein
MIDYSKMTTAELVLELEKLERGLEMDLMMDGSGELGGIISKGYDKYFDVIYQELNNREDFVFDESDKYELPF